MNALIHNQKRIFKYNYKIYSDIQAHNRSYKSHKHGHKPNTLSGQILLLNKIHPVNYAKHLSTIIGPYNYKAKQNLYNYEWFQQYHHHYYDQYRYFHVSSSLCDVPSSKVEESVETIKKQQKEKVEEQLKNDIKQMLVIEKPLGPEKQTQVIKKPLKTRIWEELVHYYHGFRLFFIDLGISAKLLGRMIIGKPLTRREHKLLLQTTSDLFRLVPFSIFIIVPFLELLLPLFLKLFPGMLPSQFQTKQERENKLKKNLAVKLEVAKFLQQTLDQMAVQHSVTHKSEEAKQFAEFFRKVKESDLYIPSDDIIKFSKKFSDEITIDSLTREQLLALCRVLELTSIGTTYFLRYLIRMRLRSLAADDKIISREGISSLDYYELQTACKARGMRAYGMSEDRLRAQLEEWIQLSLNENVPSILLLLSRALMMSEDLPTTDKLKDTIRELPDTLANQTKAAIGELEGKIDNKIKIEIIREEQRKIKEEHEEEVLDKKLKEEELKQKERESAEILVDKAPIIGDSITKPILDQQLSQATAEDAAAITPKEAQLLTDALSKTKKQLVVEKETIKELKEEIQDYKDDIEELQVARSEYKAEVQESRAAQLLLKKVNKMVSNLDKIVMDLEKKSEIILKEKEGDKEELVRIDELVEALKGLKKISDGERLKTIEAILSKIDADKDGQIKVEHIIKVIQAISNENVNLTEHQLEELFELIRKEEHLEAEDKIEKALAKSIKDTNKQNQDELLRDTAAVLKDTAKSIDNDKNVKSKHKNTAIEIIREEAKQLEEKIKAQNLIEKDTGLISGKDLSDALNKVTKTKKQYIVQKESIKEIKGEIKQYKDDIDELQVEKSQFKAEVDKNDDAQLLMQKTNKMIGHLDNTVMHMEKKIETEEICSQNDENVELVRIDELFEALKGLQKLTNSDEMRLKTIEKILNKINTDYDGQIKVQHIVKVNKVIREENLILTEQQFLELFDLIRKEEHLAAEGKIEKALAKSFKDANKQNQNESEAVIKDKAENKSC